MFDQWGRIVDYLRISVTPACNLRCIYCVATETKPVATGRLLTAPEFGAVVQAMAGLGIQKVRLTGGEPLARADLATIVGTIAGTPGIKDVALTTNGTMLAAALPDLQAAGLHRVNISLDSLQPSRYAAITGGGKLEQVWEGIHAVLQAGLTPVRLNVVLMRGVNDDEIDQFLALAKREPLEVRFIELMPIGPFSPDHAEKFISNAAIIAAHPELKLVSQGVQPAQYYTGEGYRGRVGLISALSHQFCAGCNRIRLTADGRIKPCLGQNEEFDIGPFLPDPEQLQLEIAKAIWTKPTGHHFKDGYCATRSTTATGG